MALQELLALMVSMVPLGLKVLPVTMEPLERKAPLGLMVLPESKALLD